MARKWQPNGQARHSYLQWSTTVCVCVERETERDGPNKHYTIIRSKKLWEASSTRRGEERRGLIWSKQARGLSEASTKGGSTSVNGTQRHSKCLPLRRGQGLPPSGSDQRKKAKAAILIQRRPAQEACTHRNRKSTHQSNIERSTCWPARKQLL